MNVNRESYKKWQGILCYLIILESLYWINNFRKKTLDYYQLMIFNQVCEVTGFNP